MATKQPAKPLGPNPKEVVEKVSKQNGHTDISKKSNLRDSGTTLPPITKGK